MGKNSYLRHTHTTSSPSHSGQRPDQSGIADGLALPAKPREASQNAATAPDSAARYIVNITHPAFVPQTHPVSLYTEIKTILPVVLIPILPNGRRS